MFHYILQFLRDPEHFVIDLTGIALKELKREALYFGLDDVMFPPPFVPAEQSVLTDSHGFSCFITQDVDGIWYAQERPILGEQRVKVGRSKKGMVTVCKRCNRGSFISSDNIVGKLTFIEFAAQREIFSEQPSVNECESCMGATNPVGRRTPSRFALGFGPDDYDDSLLFDS